MSRVATAAAREVQLIQIGRRELGLDEATYREMLRNLTGGKDSAKSLDGSERQRVLNHMKARGFVVKPKADKRGDTEWQHDPMLRKLRAMWYVLADAGHVERPDDTAACNAAIEAWALRMMANWDSKPSALRWANGVQFGKLVEEMKRWLQRLKLPTD